MSKVFGITGVDYWRLAVIKCLQEKKDMKIHEWLSEKVRKKLYKTMSQG